MWGLRVDVILDLNYETGCHAQYHDERLEKENFDLCHEITFVSGCCMLIPIEVIKRVGGLDEKYFMYLSKANKL